MGRLLCRKGGLVLPLLVLVCGGGPAGSKARAATLTLTSAGAHPAIAVDGSGTGHIAWSESVPGGDDRLVYCRLPRGTRTCAQVQTFAIPAENFGGPDVLIGNGEVILVARHCCTLLSHRGEVWAVSSADGGLSFGAPVMIGDTDTFHGGVAFGPGNGQVSAVGAPTDGVLYQAEPLGGPAVPYTQRALLLAGVAPASVSSVAMLDPLTPAVSYSDFGGQTFARVYDGSGSYNDAANWLPAIGPLEGDDSELAGGPRGLYLIRRKGAPARKRYVVDRFDPATGGFGNTQSLSPKGDPIFRDLSEDAAGHLHAVWVQNDDSQEPLYLRQSADGGRWQPKRRLAKTHDAAFEVRVGAGPDGGGWSLWNTESGGGAVKAAPFGPLGGGSGGACVPSVSYGKAVAIAVNGCFAKHGSRFVAEGEVRLNGIELAPKGKAKVAIHRSGGTLESTGPVLIKAGNVKLDEQRLDWRLPKHGGQPTDPAGNPIVFDAAKAGVDFLGLPVSGWVSPRLTDGAGTELPVNLELPKPFGGLLGDHVTGHTTLRLDNQTPLLLSGAELRADSVFLGIAEVHDLRVTYENVDPFVLEGTGTILLPVVQSKLETQFGLRDGAFDYGRAILSFDDPGRPVSSFTYLRSVGFEVARGPTRIAGSAVATAGPTLTLGGTKYAAATVNGTLGYEFSDPGVFTAQGEGQIFNVHATNVEARFVTTGKLSLTGAFSIPAGLVRLSGSVDGDVSLANGAFNLTGSGEGCGMEPIPGCVAGIQVLVSSKAAAGCAKAVSITLPEPIGETSVAAGAAYRWGEGFAIFAGCDLSPYRAAVSKASAATAGKAGPMRVAVPRRSRQVNLAIHGAGAAPSVTITGPGGETVTSSAAPGGTALGTAGILSRSEADATSYAALPGPAAGQWQVTANPGSAAVTQIEQARSLPRPKVRVRVERGHGRKRSLHYTLRPIDGQVVRFFERGRFGAKLIGKAKGRRGKLAFSAADGPRGKRSIEAQVQSFGLPRAVLAVGSYRAPGPIVPARPRGLRLKRRGAKLLVRWHRARNARRYVIEAKLADGRRLVETTRKTRAKIVDVPGIDSARVVVAGLKADASAGRAAHARLRAKPKHEGHRRHHHRR